MGLLLLDISSVVFLMSVVSLFSVSVLVRFSMCCLVISFGRYICCISFVLVGVLVISIG